MHPSQPHFAQSICLGSRRWWYTRDHYAREGEKSQRLIVAKWNWDGLSLLRSQGDRSLQVYECKKICPGLLQVLPSAPIICVRFGSKRPPVSYAERIISLVWRRCICFLIVFQGASLSSLPSETAWKLKRWTKVYHQRSKRHYYSWVTAELIFVAMKS